MTENNNSYWIIENGDKVYFINNKRVGTEYDAIKYLIASERMSSSKAHKLILKTKENKNKK